MTKVLIVDDHEDIVETLKILVEKEGFSSDTAFNGEELLGKIESVNPNLILLDVMMPGLTTRDILKGIKEKGLAPKIILITVVRFSEQEIQKLSEEFNVVDYIQKPFDIPLLISSIKKAAEGSGKQE